MAFDISVAECGNFIQVQVAPPITIETILQFVNDAISIGVENQINHFLFDALDSAHTKEINLFPLIPYEKIVSIGFLWNARVAGIVDPVNEWRTPVEDTLQTSGFNVRLFDDRESAVAWLEGSFTP